MFQLVDQVETGARIKVIGVGGGGGNAVAHMLAQKLEGVEFICTNTDAQALERLTQGSVVHIGKDLTRGLGAGANPDIGRQAAIENADLLRSQLEGADLVFITAGMGGGTGTGAAPVIAELAREVGALSVAVVTRPFKFEGRRRADVAEKGIEELRAAVDSLIILPNDKLVPVLGRKAPLIDAFGQANDVLKGAVQGIADLITAPGMINVDFADVRTVMASMGMAMMGTGIASGEERATLAAEMAVNSPLLEDVCLKGAKGVLVNVAAGEDLSLGEFSEVGEIVHEYAADDATVVIGTAIDPSLGDQIKVTVVATGLDRAEVTVTPVETQVVAVAEPVLVSTTTQSGVDIDLTKIELPEILRRDRTEALLSRGKAQNEELDLSLLDIPAFARR
jgi:cell division protein FtsZ